MSNTTSLYVDQGMDFVTYIELKDVSGELLDLSEYTFEGRAAKVYDSSSKFDIRAQPLPDIQGRLEIAVLRSNTANTFPGKYEFDIIMKQNGITLSKVLEGIITIIPTMSSYA